ncbi:MAG: DinB family protein [Thermoanaerobaculia bacterium]
MRSRRPTPDDAADYYFTYIDKVPDGDVVEQLAAQLVETRAMLDSLTEERGAHRYEPGKWSVKEVLGHVADAERVFAYRALAFSRGDAQPIPGMDQDEWTEGAGFGGRPVAEVVANLVAVRQSTVTLFRSLSEEQWLRRGIASNVEFQAGAIAWIIAGHELHHRAVLVDRYGIGA